MTCHEKAVDCLYNGQKQILDDLRYKSFCQRVETNTFPATPQGSPSTSAASNYQFQGIFTNSTINLSDLDLKIVKGRYIADLEHHQYHY